MAEDGNDEASDLPDRVARAVRGAGRRFEETRRAYRAGRGLGEADLPGDEAGRARIVCRRHAERRAVFLDGEACPECYEAGHPACEGCVEDIRLGQVETWGGDAGDG
ncbi:MAG: hypothetical protein ABEH77_11480 [Halobacteriaceae archaeon]